MINDLFPLIPRKEAIGICFSGGGALGFAHIGVIKALEENDIFPTHVVGTSMGAIIGTFYAAGFTAEDLLRIMEEKKLYKMTNIMSLHRQLLKTSGISDHSTLVSILNELIPHNTFSKLKKNMQVCVSNLTKARWEIKGGNDKIDMWVSASASIPVFFEAVNYKGCYYVDGCLLNNMPAQALEKDCRFIIGVDVVPHLPSINLKRPLDNFMASFRVVQIQNSLGGRDLCRFIIDVDSFDKYHELSYEFYKEIYQKGYDAAIEFIKNNQEILYLKAGN